MGMHKLASDWRHFLSRWSSCIATECNPLLVWPFTRSRFASCFGYLLRPPTSPAECFEHIEAIKGFGPRVASSSHPCTWFLLCFLVSTVPALLLLPMCKWLGDRAERKHKLCFLDTEHAWNSSGFTAVRIHQVPNGSMGLENRFAYLLTQSSLFLLLPVYLILFLFPNPYLSSLPLFSRQRWYKGLFIIWVTAHFLPSAQLSCLTVTLFLMKGQVVTDDTIAAIVLFYVMVMPAVFSSALKAQTEHQGSWYVMLCRCSGLDSLQLDSSWGCCRGLMGPTN